MVRTEAYNKILNLCKILLKHKKDGKIIHGAIHGPWGSGKTVAGKQVAKELLPVFYVKVPEGNLTKTRLIKLFSLAMGAGSMRSYDMTMDLLKGHIEQEGIYPLFILDEAQRLFRHRWILDELKDYSEDPDLRFSYLFLGDNTLNSYLKQERFHSLIKRIIYREETKGEVDKETIQNLMKEYSLKGNPEAIVKVARREKWKLLELDTALYLLSIEKQEASEENLQKILSEKGVAL